MDYENLYNLNQINNDNNLNKYNDKDKEANYVNVNNKIFTNKIEYAPQKNERRNSIFVKNPAMKDIYLLSIGEDTDVPVKSLFGESKMRDFTPLDLLRFQSQIKNFLVLTFIWIVINIIRTGINFRAKYSYIYQEKLEYPIINFVLDICLPFFLLIIYYNYQYSISQFNSVYFFFFRWIFSPKNEGKEPNDIHDISKSGLSCCLFSYECDNMYYLSNFNKNKRCWI